MYTELSSFVNYWFDNDFQIESKYRKPPNISPGLIFVRKHFLVGLYTGGLIYGGLIYGRAYIRIGFCVSNINHLLTLFLYNTRLIYKQA